MITRYQVNDKNQVEEIVQVVIATGHVSMEIFLDTAIDIMFRNSIEQWKDTFESGKWCKKHCLSSEIIRTQDLVRHQYRLSIVSDMTARDHTYFLLKWGEKAVSRELFIDTMLSNAKLEAK